MALTSLVPYAQRSLKLPPDWRPSALGFTEAVLVYAADRIRDLERLGGEGGGEAARRKLGEGGGGVVAGSARMAANRMLAVAGGGSFALLIAFAAHHRARCPIYLLGF